jgi:hypothetical protein
MCGVLLLSFAGSGCDSKGCACSWFVKKPPAESPVYTDVETLSEGSDPRVTLRVARWTGLRYRTTLEASGSLALEGVQPLVGPITTMIIDNEVLRGSADPLIERQYGGPVRLIEERSLLRSMSIRQEGVPQQIIDFWNLALAPLRGTTYLQRVAESAEVMQLRSEMLGGVKPPEAITKAVDQALEEQRHFPFRLPPRPVGVGARWRFREDLEVSGAHGAQIAEMTLRAIDANQAVVGIAIRQDAPRQSIPHPLIPGASAVLEQFRGDGSGELIVDRLTAILVRGRIVVTARSTVSADSGGQHNVATLLGANTIEIGATMLTDEDAGQGTTGAAAN